MGFSGALVIKKPLVNAGDVRDTDLIPGQEDTVEEGLATHSNVLAWRIPMDTGAWQATFHKVAKNQTQLK